MNDLAMQAAERIAPHCEHKSVGEVQRMIEADGVLVSHEDAAWLALARCPEPLTLDAAVAVMGREPRESCSTLFVWDDESIFLTKNTHEDRVSIVRMWEKGFFLPTIGQFACLVAAARMGEQS